MKKIGLISPSNNVNSFFPNRYIQGEKNLKELGFDIIKYSKLFNTNSYKEDSLKNRLDEINYVINKDADIVLATIGGYLSIQLLKYLDYDTIKNKKIAFCGFSDITALLLAIYCKTKVVQLYGPVFFVNLCEYNGIDNYTKKYFINAINGQNSKFIPSNYVINEYIDWNILEKEKRTKKRISKGNDWKSFNSFVSYGKLIGGNLATILLILGTEYLPISEFDNSILFLEDCETNINEFCSYLESLRLNNIFSNIKGLIIGKFDRDEMNNEMDDFIKNYFKNDKFNILYNVDFGHTYPILTLPIGSYAKLDTINNEFEIINYNGILDE